MVQIIIAYLTAGVIIDLIFCRRILAQQLREDGLAYTLIVFGVAVVIAPSLFAGGFLYGMYKTVSQKRPE